MDWLPCWPIKVGGYRGKASLRVIPEGVVVGTIEFHGIRFGDQQLQFANLYTSLVELSFNKF
jgi:hypothetical protein